MATRDQEHEQQPAKTPSKATVWSEEPRAHSREASSGEPSAARSSLATTVERSHHLEQVRILRRLVKVRRVAIRALEGSGQVVAVALARRRLLKDRAHLRDHLLATTHHAHD